MSSVPPGAQVLLDDQDTGTVTDCELSYVPYGSHSLKLKKPSWVDHDQTIEVMEGPIGVRVEKKADGTYGVLPTPSGLGLAEWRDLETLADALEAEAGLRDALDEWVRNQPGSRAFPRTLPAAPGPDAPLIVTKTPMDPSAGDARPRPTEVNLQGNPCRHGSQKYF